MLYDWTGREIGDAPAATSRAMAARLVHWEDMDREEADESRALTPSKLDVMFRQANGGDPEAQARLALEIEEKNWDIGHNLATRRAAVMGIRTHCVPEDEEDERAAEIADEAAAMLRKIRPGNDTDVGLKGMIQDLLSAILPGYNCMEILWGAGGRTIEGFAPVATSAVTFRQSREPLLKTRNNANGLPLVPRKFIFHRHLARSGDATRGGLIRPLGWMHCFELAGVKDLMRFAEKFGMPFVSARIEDNAWEKDRTKIAYLIRNFGSDGGAVFSKAVELELLQAADSNGELYFKLLDYFGAAITKVITGQTATSGDAGGFSKGQVQGEVRQDILEADCEAIAETIRNDVLTPWTAFNYGEDAPVPVFKFNYEPPEDLKGSADVINVLANAGYQVDPSHVEKKFGMPLVKDNEGNPKLPTKQDLYQYHLQFGIATKNEVRKRLGLEPIEGGDVPATPIELSAAMRGDADAVALMDAQGKKKLLNSRRLSGQTMRW